MYDVYGLGNALVDMEFTIDDQFLSRHSIPKGHMTLVDEDKIDALVGDLLKHQPEKMSGGSAANTLIAVQAFGAKTFYSCKVAEDDTGSYFLTDLSEAGVVINANAVARSGKSGHCLVLITPDAERSMNTFLGVSNDLSTGELDEAALARSSYFYVEGYLSSSPGSKHAAVTGRQIAEDNGVKTAVSLSDPSMVEFFREPLTEILGNGVDHLFCNEEEALAWAGTDRLEIAINELKDVAAHLNITLGAKGSLVVDSSSQTLVPGRVVKAVDTTGAGDMYAGGCLYGWVAGMSPEQAAGLGNHAAAELVQTLGARLRQLDAYQQTLARFVSSGTS